MKTLTSARDRIQTFNLNEKYEKTKFTDNSQLIQVYLIYIWLFYNVCMLNDRGRFIILFSKRFFALVTRIHSFSDNFYYYFIEIIFMESLWIAVSILTVDTKFFLVSLCFD